MNQNTIAVVFMLLEFSNSTFYWESLDNSRIKSIRSQQGAILAYNHYFIHGEVKLPKA